MVNIMNEFIILNKIKWLISYTENYIYLYFNKDKYILKSKIEDNLYNLLENCIRANINTGNIRSKYQKEMLVNIILLDYYIGESKSKKIIKSKRFNSFVNCLSEIRKMTISWSNNEKNK